MRHPLLLLGKVGSPIHLKGNDIVPALCVWRHRTKEERILISCYLEIAILNPPGCNRLGLVRAGIEPLLRL